MPEFHITRLGLKGDGITDDDRFIPFSLPGERFSGAFHDGHFQGERVQDSGTRTPPPCPHFGTCGGCSLQHASDDFLAAWKSETITRALHAQGIDAPFRPIATSPPHSRRRATFSARRTKKTTQVGFHRRGGADIFPVEQCHLLMPEIMAALPACHALAGLGASRKGEIKISVTHSATGPDISVLEGAKPLDGPLRARLATLANELGLARLSWNGEQIADRTRPVQPMGAAQVLPPSGAFLQATHAGEAALVAAMQEAVFGAKRIADLFAGCGTFALPLAAQAEVHAVEGEADMLKALDTGWRFTQGLKTVTTEARDLFARPLVPLDLKRFDAVVVDPPRAGAKAQMEEIATSGIGLVGAVSCNPVSFARDAKILIDAGFTLDWVQPVDQFRWSGHVELAAKFSR